MRTWVRRVDKIRQKVSDRVMQRTFVLATDEDQILVPPFLRNCGTLWPSERLLLVGIGIQVIIPTSYY